MVYTVSTRDQIGFMGDMNMESLEHFCFQLQEQFSPGKPLEIFLHSNGGSVSVMVTMLAQLKAYRDRGILRVIGSGWVASCAVPLLAAGTKGERYILGSDSTIFLHEIQSSAGRDGMSASVLEQEALKIQRSHALYVRHMAELTSQTEEFWRDKLEGGGNVYLTPQEAVTWGIADHVVEVMPPSLKGVDESKKAD